MRERTWASTHFKLRIVEPRFWAASKFLDAPVLIDDDISASCKMSLETKIFQKRTSHVCLCPKHISQQHKALYFNKEKLNNSISHIDTHRTFSKSRRGAVMETNWSSDRGDEFFLRFPPSIAIAALRDSASSMLFVFQGSIISENSVQLSI
jgi:hypothetical protein